MKSTENFANPFIVRCPCVGMIQRVWKGIFRTLFQNRTEVNTIALLHSEVQNQIQNRILEIHSSYSTVTATLLKNICLNLSPFYLMDL